MLISRHIYIYICINQTQRKLDSKVYEEQDGSARDLQCDRSSLETVNQVRGLKVCQNAFTTDLMTHPWQSEL